MITCDYAHCFSYLLQTKTLLNCQQLNNFHSQEDFLSLFHMHLCIVTINSICFAFSGSTDCTSWVVAKLKIED